MGQQKHWFKEKLNLLKMKEISFLQAMGGKNLKIITHKLYKK
jgi:hypothetical protein